MTTKMATTAEFAMFTSPVYWIKVSATAPQTEEQTYDLCKRWIESRCGASICYFDDIEKTFYFGSEGDRMIFRMWLADNPTFEEWDAELS
jgi:hypothetical protein